VLLAASSERKPPSCSSCSSQVVVSAIQRETWRGQAKLEDSPLPGSVQGQVGWGFGQHGLVEGVPAQGRDVGMR